MAEIKQKKSIEGIAQKYSLELILLFGSRVSGKTHRESDYDIAYLSKRTLSFEEEYHLNYEFTNVFEVNIIDTVNLKKAPPLLMERIFQNHQILFCSNDKTYYLYKIYAFKKFIEAAPLFRLRDELINKYFSMRKIWLTKIWLKKK